jgi:hypothetical protein
MRSVHSMKRVKLREAAATCFEAGVKRFTPISEAGETLKQMKWCGRLLQRRGLRQLTIGAMG